MSILANSNAIESGGYNLSNSLRFRASASAYLTRTFSTPTNNKIWTWSSWVKRGALGSTKMFFGYGISGTLDYFGFNSSDQLYYFSVDNGGSTQRANYNTVAVFRDPSAWYHIVFVVDTTQATAANRFKLYVNGTQQTLTTTTSLALNWNTYINSTLSQGIGYVFDGGSPYFDGYMTEINFIDGQALTPSSFGATDAITGVWKPSLYTGTYGNNGFYLPFKDSSTNTQNYFTYSEDFTNAAWTKGNSSITANTTTAPIGATTASKLVENTTNAGHNIYRSFTETNVTRTLSVYAKLADATRPYIYLNISNFVSYDCSAIFNLSNGTIFSTSTSNPDYSSISSTMVSVGNGWYRCTISATKGSVNTTNGPTIGLCDASGNTSYAGSGTTLGAYIWGAQFNNGTTVSPYVYTGSSAQSTAVNNLGRDYSLSTGGYNTWIPTNISVTAGTTYDSMTDVPTLTSETAANYATFAGTNLGTYANATITEAGLKVSVSAGGTPDGGKAYAPFGMSDGSGKWYFEMTCVDPGASNQRLCFGIANVTTNPNAVAITNAYIASASGAHGNYNIGTFTTNDVLQVAYDSGTNKLWFGKNGTWYNSGNPSAGTTPLVTVTSGITYVPFSHYASSGGGPGVGAWNFGQRPFSYTPPTGYVALNTYNLPTPTILKGNKYMDATLYTGNGSTQSITNAAGFKPDFVWIKNRTTGSQDHGLFDSIRGATKTLYSDLTNAEATVAGNLTAFNSNGFSVGSENMVNQSTANMIGWQWQAGQGSSSSNTSGSITSTVSVNATAGFSVVTYTGTGSGNNTVGHGLGVAPKMIIMKNRDRGIYWIVYHASVGKDSFLRLNTTDAAAASASIWGTSNPTSTVFGGAGTDASNGFYTGEKIVAYCWAAIPGYSAFTSFTGNGSSDGVFVYLGFRPKFVMIKSSSIAGEWAIYDSNRGLYNPNGSAGGRLQANTSNAETGNDSAQYIDFLSNGFKIRNSSGFDNQSSATYIVAAWASNPFKNSLAF